MFEADFDPSIRRNYPPRDKPGQEDRYKADNNRGPPMPLDVSCIIAAKFLPTRLQYQRVWGILPRLPFVFRHTIVKLHSGKMHRIIDRDVVSPETAREKPND